MAWLAAAPAASAQVISAHDLNRRKLQREARRATMCAQERQQLVSSWKARGREARASLRMKRGQGQ